jgi:hypothetical protein
LKELPSRELLQETPLWNEEEIEDTLRKALNIRAVAIASCRQASVI